MSEHELRRLLADTADLAPTTLDRRFTVRRRRRWPAAVAVAAAAAAVTAVAVLPQLTDAPPTPVRPAPTVSPTPTEPPYVGDGVLVVEPIPDATPALSQRDAELLMVNVSPPAPLPPYTGFASSRDRVRFTLGRVTVAGSAVSSNPFFSFPQELPLAWVASYDTGPTNCVGEYVMAHVVAADGSAAFRYMPPLPACTGDTVSDARSALIEPVVDLVSVPWTSEPITDGTRSTLRFQVPTCADSTVLAIPGGLLAVAEVPVGASCPGTRTVVEEWRGPVEVHGELGPFRQTRSDGIVPLLEELPY